MLLFRETFVRVFHDFSLYLLLAKMQDWGDKCQDLTSYIPMLLVKLTPKGMVTSQVNPHK